MCALFSDGLADMVFRQGKREMAHLSASVYKDWHFFHGRTDPRCSEEIAFIGSGMGSGLCSPLVPVAPPLVHWSLDNDLFGGHRKERINKFVAILAPTMLELHDDADRTLAGR